MTKIIMNLKDQDNDFRRHEWVMLIRPKILILNILGYKNIESRINVSDRLAHPLYAQWRG